MLDYDNILKNIPKNIISKNVPKNSTKWYISIIYYYDNCWKKSLSCDDLRIDLPFQRGDRVYTSESDVRRRQILMCEAGSCTKRLIYL